MTKEKKPRKPRKTKKKEEPVKVPEINTQLEYWKQVSGVKFNPDPPQAGISPGESVICAIIKCKCGNIYNYRSGKNFITVCSRCDTHYQLPLVIKPVELNEQQISFIKRKCGGIS
jgi:hypothetical protein